MINFSAIDFETANENKTSICSIGLVVVREGIITERFYSLIKPEPEYYSYWNTQVHGITLADTEKSPVFSQVWEEIESLVEGFPLVAHNKGFDERCLKAAFRMYQMDYPDYEFHCSLQMARRNIKGLLNYKLSTVAEHIGFRFHHHHALEDAEACARIVLAIGGLR
ncbi:3'-5' exonuclease [Bacteroidales bacterium OttesenSCG-928-M11]|nr:3'-5' exonuclease [Bacteroidales bacterium OttesenSCG-928-M11]